MAHKQPDCVSKHFKIINFILSNFIENINTVKPVLSGHPWGNNTVLNTDVRLYYVIIYVQYLQLYSYIQYIYNENTYIKLQHIMSLCMFQ